MSKQYNQGDIRPGMRVYVHKWFYSKRNGEHTRPDAPRTKVAYVQEVDGGRIRVKFDVKEIRVFEDHDQWIGLSSVVHAFRRSKESGWERVQPSE